jgi:hypothetical protein
MFVVASIALLVSLKIAILLRTMVALLALLATAFATVS